MLNWFEWFTRPENTQIFALVLFFVTYCLILLFVFTGKRRKERYEKYRNIPLEDEPQHREAVKRKGEDDER